MTTESFQRHSYVHLVIVAPIQSVLLVKIPKTIAVALLVNICKDKKLIALQLFNLFFETGRDVNNPLCGECEKGKTPSFVSGSCCFCNENKPGILFAVILFGLVLTCGG